MVDELEGDIVSFRSKKEKKVDRYNVEDNIGNNINNVNNRIQTNNANVSNPNLIPDDIVSSKHKIKKTNIEKLEGENIDKKTEEGSKCEITGEIVPYKKAIISPGLPPGPPTDMSVITKILQEHHTILKQIAKIEEDLKNFLTGYSETGTYFELRTFTTKATPIQPSSPDTISKPIYDSSGSIIDYTTGYNAANININKQGKNAPKLWIVNDGFPGAGIGDNLYVITSSDGTAFSPEFLMVIGETRLVYNVYEVRFRSPKAGNIVRITEREPIVPYVTTVTNTLTPIGNRENFIARNVTVNMIDSVLPSITIPDGFALSIRSNVNNTFGSHIYISRTDATVTTNRNTLYAGDVIVLTISDTNLIHVAGSEDGLTVDILVEQD